MSSTWFDIGEMREEGKEPCLEVGRCGSPQLERIGGGGSAHFCKANRY